MLQTRTLEKNNITLLSRQVELLRSVMIGWVGRDQEGEYNPKFVEEVFENAQDNLCYRFQDKKSFLQTLKK